MQKSFDRAQNKSTGHNLDEEDDLNTVGNFKTLFRLRISQFQSASSREEHDFGFGFQTVSVDGEERSTIHYFDEEDDENTFWR